MVERVKGWLAELKDVRIFTARVGPATEGECSNALQYTATEEDWQAYQVALIEAWCEEHLGQKLPITATKDFHMYELWDDRCVQMISNTGILAVDHVLRAALDAAGDPDLEAITRRMLDL